MKPNSSSQLFSIGHLKPESKTTLHDSRYQTPVKIRASEKVQLLGTHTSHLNSTSFYSRSSSVCQIDNRLSPLKGMLPYVDGNSNRDSGREGFYGDRSSMSLLKNIAREVDGPNSQRNFSRNRLGSLDSRKVLERSHDNLTDSRLSPEFLQMVREDLKKVSNINRDISNTMEPIAKETSWKFLKVNEYHAKRSGNLEGGPKSKFEEEILDNMNKRFLWFKLENEIKVIKPIQPERFVVNAREEVYFKLRVKGLRFPLKGKVDPSSKTANCIYEILVSTSVPRPRRNNCDYRFIGKNFVIEHSTKFEWLYFTLAALTDLDVKLSISPNINNRQNDDNSCNNEVPAYFAESYKSGVERIKAHKNKLYPFLNYTNEQMSQFAEEISNYNEQQIKAEKHEKSKRLAKNGRDIVTANLKQVCSFNKDQFLEQLQNFCRKRDESIENVLEKKEHAEYEDKLRRFVVQNRNEIKRSAKELYEKELWKVEKKKRKAVKWLKMLVGETLVHSLANRIWTYRANKLLMKIKNRNAALIQKEYRKYISWKAEPFMRKLKSIRLTLNCSANMAFNVAKKRAEKVLKDFMSDILWLRELADSGYKATAAIRIQRMGKRYYFRRHFQRVCLNLMLEDAIAGISDEKKKAADKKKGKKKEKDKLKTQFDNALQISRDFRVFIANQYLSKLVKIYLKKFRPTEEPESLSPKKPDREVEQEEQEQQVEKAPKEKTKKKTVIVDGSKAKKVLRSRATSIVVETAKAEIWRNSNRIINREALYSYIEEKYASIIQKAKKQEKTQLTWLFQ